VLIISQSSNEFSSEIVMDWINYLGHDVVRLNGDSFESLNESITIHSKNDISLLFNEMSFSKKYYSIWIRRWSSFNSVKSIINNSIDAKLNSNLIINLANSINQDIFATYKLILNLFESNKQLSTINQLNVNKLDVLKVAQKNKLNIPKFILTNKKSSLLTFSNNQKVILKDLSVPFTFIEKQSVYTTFGEIMDDIKIKNLPDSFFLSFFQEYIEKKYEIRVFYLNEKIFSMAIFSQRDSKTQVDFRKYNKKDPNRTVPYKLPISVEKKIVKLMKTLNLNTGSIDLLKSVNGKYYFLEVNPVGQFGMVSSPCNYNLDYEIASYLIK
jgi:ATP-GRASP peptide maturase of grasp-with-spasm system